MYTAITAGCGLVSFIYELFSHGVYSNFMVYLFAIPLFLGVLPELIAQIWPKLAVGSSWQRTVHAFAVATLVVGSLLQGIVEIYGTTNQFIGYYFWAGIGLLFVSLSIWTMQFIKRRRMKEFRTQL